MAKNRTGTLGKQILQQYRDRIISDLKPLGARLFRNATTGSQYIKFADPRVGSLRVADHGGYEKYHYKWNVVIGGRKRTVQTEKTTRRYYSERDLLDFYRDIRQHQRDITERYGPYKVENDRYAAQRNQKSKRRNRG